MRTRSCPALLMLAVLAACGDSSPGDGGVPSDSIALDALIGVPLLPGARIGEIGGTAETAQVELSAAGPVDSVATWYRRALLGRGWAIASDVATRDGNVTVHATDPTGRPLWIIIGPDSARGGTVVTVIGAVREKTGAGRQ